MPKEMSIKFETDPANFMSKELMTPIGMLNLCLSKWVSNLRQTRGIISVLLSEALSPERRVSARLLTQPIYKKVWKLEAFHDVTWRLNHRIRCGIGGNSQTHRIWWKTTKIGGSQKPAVLPNGSVLPDLGLFYGPFGILRSVLGPFLSF